MTGRRVLPLLVGLWACSAFGQVFQATSSIKLDGGASFARAYMAHVASSNKDYALVNAGETIQVFDTSGIEHLALEPPLGSSFSSFGILNGVQNGSATTTTIVAVADVTAPACATAMCLRIFSWDDTNGFQLLNTAPTTVLSATAVAIQSQTISPSSPLNAYYATSGSPALYEQVVNVSSSNGSVTFGSFNSRSLPITGSTVVGLSIDVPSTTAYLSDDSSILYTFPADVTNLDGGIFAQPSAGGFSQIAGLFLFPPTNPTGLLAGGIGSGVYELDPTNPASIVVGSFIVIATDGGSTVPTAASYNAGQTLVAVTEDNTGSGAFLHIVPPVAAPDAGDGGADGGSDGGVVDGGGGADAGGIPTVPIVQPGPGAGPGPSNSCNCSSAGGAPLLLVFLLPLFAPRRRR